MQNVVIIMQARTSSARLPAKALLNLAGMPSVVLAARRAQNAGHEVIVATSDDPSDDVLANILQQHGIKTYRGSLNNVQSRYLNITEPYHDNDLVIRLTGDNSFPDGEFMHMILKEISRLKCDYLATNSPTDGLPYGMSAEVFKVGSLRERKNTTDSLEKEHVTTEIRKLPSAQIITRQGWDDLGHLRCTLDGFDDYLILNKVFMNIEDPITVSWKDLCDKLKSLDDSPKFRIPWRIKNHKIVSRLTIGSAQIGLSNYGRLNTSGQLDRTGLTKFINKAVDYGINAIDTARAYGDAEKRLGEVFTGSLPSRCEIITKLSPLSELDKEATLAEIRSFVDASIYESCFQLRSTSLETLMLHRWSHYKDHNGKIWDRLIELKELGVIQKLGASVSTPEEAIEALAEPLIQKIQLPINLLDYRWRDPKFLEAINQYNDTEIEARSVYLQGVLLGEDTYWPQSDDYVPAEYVSKLNSLVTKLNRKSKSDLCLAYIASKPWIDRIVLGMENLEQLEDNTNLICNEPLTDEEAMIVDECIGKVPLWLLDPSQWDAKSK